MRCPLCGCEQDEPTVPEPPYDDTKDHTKCADCNGKGTYQPLVGPPVACSVCEGSGWL